MSAVEPHPVREARAELARREARAAELRAFLAAAQQTETQRRHRDAAQLSARGTGLPCDWCGDSSWTSGTIRRGQLTGEIVCANGGLLSPCRIAWMTGVSPEVFRRRICEHLTLSEVFTEAAL